MNARLTNFASEYLVSLVLTKFYEIHAFRRRIRRSSSGRARRRTPVPRTKRSVWSMGASGAHRRNALISLNLLSTKLTKYSEAMLVFQSPCQPTWCLLASRSGRSGLSGVDLRLGIEEWTCRRDAMSTHRCVDGRRIDASVYRRVDASTRRHVDA